MPQWSSKKVDELRNELKSRGLPVSGKKSDLISRLEAASDSDYGQGDVVEGEVFSKISRGSKLEF